jgi:hypothetical protein
MKLVLSLHVLLVAAALALAAPGAEAQRHRNGYAYGSGRIASGPYRGSSLWVPGRYELVRQRVFVPGRCERVWVEPVCEVRFDSCGRPFTVCIRAGTWKTVRYPGSYEVRAVRVWRPGHWSRGC